MRPVACSAALQVAFADAIGRCRDAAVRPAERRRSRRGEWRWRHRHRHVVRSLWQRRRQLTRRGRRSPPRTPRSPRACFWMFCSMSRNTDEPLTQQVAGFVDREFAGETAFPAERVKVPSDNPPGDCAAHGARAKALLEGLGWWSRRFRCRPTWHAVGMVTATNLVVRRRYGAGPTIALNAHGDVVPPGEGWTHDPYGAAIEADGTLRPRVRRQQERLSPPTPSPCWRCWSRCAAPLPATSSCTSPTTRSSAASSGPAGC